MSMSSSSPPDPPSSSSVAATSTPQCLFPNPPPQPSSRDPTPPVPQSQPHYHLQHQLHPATSFAPSPQPPLYKPQSLPNFAPRVPTNSIHPQLPKPNDPPQGILYPLASSGRGFLPKPIRSQPPDQSVTIANPGAFPPRPLLAYSHHHVRPYGFANSDPHAQPQPVHLVRSTHLQHTLLGSTAGVIPPLVKGVPVSKVVPSPSSVSDCNGYKDLRDRSRDDTYATVRDRKVRISDSVSLYALCQSWLRNGFPEENQPQYMESVKSLPKPLPIPVGDAHSPVKKEGDKEEEDEGSIEHLSPQEMLQRHIKRAKRVRARLREERLQRIVRYKTRLALLLPPIVEQQFRNDTAAGN